MTRRSLALTNGLMLALLLAGCGSTGTDPGGGGSPAASPSPQPPVLGAGAAVSIPYGSFAEWLRDAARGTTGGVAIVRVVDVSPVRWSTASGAGPGPPTWRG